MGVRLRVFLNAEEERTLYELRTATTVSQRVRDRAEVIRMSHQGLYVEAIAHFFKWNVRTVRETIRRWETRGLGGLWDAVHPGAKPRWQPEDLEYLEECLRQEQRSYNSQQLAQTLEQERNVKLSPDHLRQVLKKRGCCGSGPGKVTVENKTRLKKQPSLRT
jgi:transposase